MTIASGGLTAGYLLHVAGSGPPSRVYRETVELAVAAEELGFGSFWVAQHRSTAEPRRAACCPRRS
jgi:alkanesulfonate monooxygenase SsuD/methylene tetrahydromethanopterin reductase-like flavin-dependent oxidoreductase (luciferase family)